MHISFSVTILFSCAVLSLATMSSCTPPRTVELSWESLPGPFARNISTVFPLRTGLGILAGLTNGEIAFSADGGKTWAYRTPASKGGVVNRFVDVPERASMLYAATDHGLFLSADTARSWQRVFIGNGADTATAIRTLAIDPWKPSVCYAGTDRQGLYRSADGGTTWSKLQVTGDSVLTTATVLDLSVDPRRPDRLVAALGTLGFASSSDAGVTWELIGRGNSIAGAQATHVLLHPQNSDLLLIGDDAGSIYRSTNFGKHWSPVRPATAGDRILSLWCDPAQPNTVLAGTGTGVFQSKNFGESWQPWGESLPPFSTTLVQSASPPHRIFAFGNSIGLRVSVDRGATWQAADAHLGGVTASMLSIGPGGKTVYAVVGNTLLKYDPDSSGWQSLGRGLIGGTLLSFAIDPRDDSALYATSMMGAFRSTDGGAHWTSFARPLQTTPHILVPHPWFPTRLLASGKQGIFVSTDRGNTWRESRPAGKTPPVQAFTFRATNAGIIFAASSPAAVLFSQDGGISWESTRYGLGTDSLMFLSLDDRDTQVCYAWTTRGGCYRSLNSGLEWSRFSPPWNPEDHVLFASDPRNASQLVALVNGRMVYLTMNGGTLWTLVLDRRLPGDPVTLAWNANKGTLFAGLRDRGIVRFQLSETLKKNLGQFKD